MEVPLEGENYKWNYSKNFCAVLLWDKRRIENQKKKKHEKILLYSHTVL